VALFVTLLIFLVFRSKSWEKGSPVEFLTFLKTVGLYTVWDDNSPPPDWIKPRHIPELIALLDSEEPCGAVAMSISSSLPTGPSSVGREAAFLIEGFRRGNYPPELNSWQFVPKSKAEIVNWWKEYKAAGAP